MATKDISDRQVCEAYAEMRRQMDEKKTGFEYADDILARVTKQPLKVCERAMERAYGRGYVEVGMWIRGGWLTDKGKALIDQPVTKPLPTIDQKS